MSRALAGAISPPWPLVARVRDPSIAAMPHGAPSRWLGNGLRRVPHVLLDPVTGQRVTQSARRSGVMSPPGPIHTNYGLATVYRCAVGLVERCIRPALATSIRQHPGSDIPRCLSLNPSWTQPTIAREARLIRLQRALSTVASPALKRRVVQHTWRTHRSLPIS